MMEESCEVHSEDSKALPAKYKKRRLKTPSQVEALEKFYFEHKYPSEELKSQFAESVGLTEKQVSGWFCHRRLKDKRSLYVEVSANGRQDRSSGIIQDRGSGLKQDSCGSTKQGNNRHDPREVESRRFSGRDFSVANLAYDHDRHHNRNYNDMDDTSSGSSLLLQRNFLRQSENHFDVVTSRYLPKNENIEQINLMGIRTRIGPSGYLKVKGKVENAAVTAVKRQLGRHYREDGPQLGVEFDSLPPGAFESSTREPDNEPHFLGDASPLYSTDVPGIHNKSNSCTRYEAYNSKMSLHNSDLDGTSFKIMHGSDHHENSMGHHSKPMRLLPNHGNPFPGWKSSLDRNEISTGEISVYDGSRLYKMRAKHDVEGGSRMDYVSSCHMPPHDRKVTGKHREPWLCKSDDVSLADAQIEHLEAENSNKTLEYG
ncbi:Homeobox-DDT domain protein [Actinidia chinensis var. chinensis]|uniref:Homeobox-DDT domain protein n=1 Tax=Actinidia chinensis var. chinensis TaxID=1590841 RepID=A0A2R6PQW6_ACTCC|nr:Homeobox-DDT domain protein [Actinidia chinensis var. chinensis]